MTSLLKEFRLYLFIFQWFLFLTMFFFYTTTPQHSYVFFSLLFFIYLLYTIAFFYSMPRRAWFTLAFLDICLSLFIIVQTGGWKSPFILYAYTTLLWLGMVVRRKIFWLIAVMFLTGCFMLSYVLPQQLVLPQPQLAQSKFLLDIMTWSSFGFLFFVLLNKIKEVYSSCHLYYLFLNRLAGVINATEVCTLLEKTLMRIFSVEQAFVCLFVEREEDENWRRQYFVQTLLELDRELYQTPTNLTLADFKGKEKTFFIYPLQLDGENWGVMLLAFKNESRPSRFQMLLLRLLSVSLCHHLKHRSERFTLAHQLHQNMHKKLAQDMHDGLAQQLFFVSAQLYKIKQNVSVMDVEKLTIDLDHMEQRIKGCHIEVRNYISHLRNDRQSSHNFEAIEQLIKRMTIGTEVLVNLVTRGRIAETSFEVMDTVYHLVEEAVANSLKHAQATTLDVEIEATSVQIKVCIRDNGVGFNADLTKTGYGIIGMHERIADVGGSVTIQSKLNGGTEISAIIPRKAVEKYG